MSDWAKIGLTAQQVTAGIEVKIQERCFALFIANGASRAATLFSHKLRVRQDLYIEFYMSPAVAEIALKSPQNSMGRPLLRRRKKTPTF
jgi:hypothetical protein